MTVKRKGKERKNSTRLVLNLPGAVDGQILFVCLLAVVGLLEEFYLLMNLFIIYWILDSSGDINVEDGWFFVGIFGFLWWMLLSFGGCEEGLVGIGYCGCDEEEGIIDGRSPFAMKMKKRGSFVQ